MWLFNGFLKGSVGGGQTGTSKFCFINALILTAHFQKVLMYYCLVIVLNQKEIIVEAEMQNKFLPQGTHVCFS